jgi:hypothetical protein
LFFGNLSNKTATITPKKFLALSMIFIPFRNDSYIIFSTIIKNFEGREYPVRKTLSFSKSINNHKSITFITPPKIVCGTQARGEKKIVCGTQTSKQTKKVLNKKNAS